MILINLQNRLKISLRCAIIIAAFCFTLIAHAQNAALKQKMQVRLDSFCKAGNFPGLTLGVVFPDNTAWNLASGTADSAKHQAMPVDAYLEQGSVGKTYVAAIAMQFIKEGKFKLDDKVSKYLGDYPWFKRLPNAEDITIKMLMEHTSGIMRYEFKDTFTKDLSKTPDKVWKPEELLSYIFDEKPTFKAGEGWDYADTNYIVLGMIMEKITGMAY
jgi:D-alanyl-D-alanine carboxypeptidase